MIVKLNVIELDLRTYCSVNCLVGPIRVERNSSEVRRLRSVGDYSVGEFGSECFGQSNQPCLPDSTLKSSRVLPIHIYSVQIVLDNVVRDVIPTSDSVDALTGWQLCTSEGTHHKFDPLSVEQSQQGSPDAIVSGSEGGGSEVQRRLIP